MRTGLKTPKRRATIAQTCLSGPAASISTSNAASCEVEEVAEDGAYYSEPERDVPWSGSCQNILDPPLPRAETVCDFGVMTSVAQHPGSYLLNGRSSGAQASETLSEQQRGRVTGPGRPELERRSPSSSSCTPRLAMRAASEPGTLEKGTGDEATRTESGLKQPGELAVVEQVSFLAWLKDEVKSRPDEVQLEGIPRSHLEEVAKSPWQLEKLLLLGFLLCLDILLYELSYTPLQVARSLPRLMVGLLREALGRPASSRGQRCQGGCAASTDTSLGSQCNHAGVQETAGGTAKRLLTITEQGDFMRFSLLILNVSIILLCFDVSWTYHYIRGESFLKLYVFFNMLEMLERWCRSIGVDLFDLAMASARQSWHSLLPKYVCILIYCFGHSTIHLVRVVLLNVAINTSSSAVFLIIVTNNFGEIKSTVFKRYEQKSLFPIVTSDVVERFYLMLDIIFVLARLSISTQGGLSRDIAFWLSLLVILEVSTDWIKFCLIVKFSELPALTFEVYREVLLADILLCRCGRLGSGSSATAPSNDGKSAVLVPFRGIHSFSHSLQRRLGFSGVPMTTILVVHFVFLCRSPCVLAVRNQRTVVFSFIVGFFLLFLLSKILLGIILVGFAARRRHKIKRGLDLFPKIKSL